MTVSDDSEFMTVDRTVGRVQKLGSVSLCLIAGGLSAYTAVNGVWSVTALFLLGLALAAQSYRMVEDGRTVVDRTD
ncbi:hypothetical protein NDI56_10520 [Haloarcula sp. S1CR25-12]|uniref:DUF2892 domain-containing protein n=1 Tax=Haloarcula saliterrae TaxID=2950534 RepID=A0ABU2FDA9_9EURY|nr:hypothetical protein [Haloarcula sp. S1CR25-12]MDS0259825.1 hypothetical protein [Haloarcula sp. S1CR25-12]